MNTAGQSGAAPEDPKRIDDRASMLDSMLANVPGVAYRCLNDRAWTMLYVSEGLRDLTGYDVADIVGNARISYNDLIHPEDRQRVWDSIQAGLAESRTYQVEYRVVRVDGGIRWVWEQGRGVPDADGRVLFLDGVVIDVTARALAEQELRESHERFRSLFELEADAVVLADSGSGRVLEANQRATELYGLSAKEWKSLTVYDMSAEPEDTARVIQAREAAVARRWHKKKDGTVFPVEISLSHFEVGGRPAHLAAIREISGRVAEEQEFRRSQEQLWAVVEASPFPVAIVDVDRELIEYVSKSAQDLVGYTFRTASEWNHRAYPDPEYRRAAIEQWLPAVERARAAQGTPVYGGEYRVTCADGSTRDCELYAAVTAGKLVVTMNDVTARKRASDELRASEERFRTLVEEAPLAILVQTGGAYQYGNRAARALYGESLEKPLVGRRVLDLTHPDYRSLISERMTAVEGQQSQPATRSTVLTLDGRLVEVESSAVPVSYEGVDGALVFMTDITERLKTEEALRLTQYSVDNVADAVFWTDADARLIYVSQSLCRSVGYDESELLHMSVFDLDPSLTPSYWRETWSALQERGSLVVESVHQTKKGQTFPVEVAANRVRFGYRDYNCVVARDISERKFAEAEAARLNQIVEQSQTEIHVFDAHTLRFVEVNEMARQNLGYTMDELRTMTPIDLNPTYTKDLFEKVVSPLRQGITKKLRYTTEHRRKDGSLYPVEVHMRLHGGGQRALFVGALIDITDRLQAEEELRLRDEQLQQAQKMEAVGRLAGGVAHDFNNLLTAVLGYSDLILAGDLSRPEEFREDVVEIKRAALRAKELTAQILAFSRRQPRQPRVVPANDLVRESQPLLRRTLGEDIELEYRLSKDVGLVEVDPGQFSQVLVNLAVNARDAMPGGGRLVVDTSRIMYEGTPWMRLTVADTGHGMDSDTLDRAFEPFFTTKRPGEGTGLGLATVYGIVAQNGGKISVSSEPGAGTIFTVLLPGVSDTRKPAAHAPESVAPNLPSGRPGREHATILLVEDEAAVRSLAARVLKEQGFEVLEAADGAEASALARESAAVIDLLLTDVVLPGELQGDGVARAVLEECPGAKCMFMSGYPREVIAKAGRLTEGVNYLEKPFTPATLVRRVRELIDA